LQLYETFGGGKIRFQRRADVSTMPLQTIGRLASETGAF